MYRVLLVDDEEDVREGLVLEIDWEALGLRIVGLAENGREALELAERVEPDIVITDISMPFMNGLELAHELRRHNPLIKLVILTGYDEFDYARQAVSLSVDEYLLKPFSAGHLTELLTRLRSQMAADVAERENLRKLKEYYHNSLPLLQSNFLASLLYRQRSEDYVHDKARQLDLDLTGFRYSISVLTLHKNETDRRSGQTGEEADDTAIVLWKDAELKQFAALNIASEVWNEFGAGYVFWHQDMIVLLFIDRDGLNERELERQEALDRVLRSMNHYLRLAVTIGAGSLVDSLGLLTHSYTDAMLALDYRLVPGTDRLIYIDEVERRAGGQLRFDELKQQMLTRCLKAGTEDELEEALDTIFAEVTRQHGSHDIQLYLIEVVTTVWKATLSSGEELEELFGAGFQVYAELLKLAGLEEAKRRLRDICQLVQRRIASGRQHAYRDMIDQALQYTKAHYRDPELSIQKVCSHLHISQGYFCSIFKKEVQLTFLQYLMQLRMEEAKRLLRSTGLKSFEIAAEVGFAEPNYFSFCFKKQVGVSPKEYRKQAERAEGEERHI